VSEYKVLGIETTLPFFGRVLQHSGFVAGDIDTSFVETVFAGADLDRSRNESVRLAVAAAAIQAFRERRAARLRPSGDGTDRSAWWDAGLREAHGRRRGN
jgi:propionyl-CoA carboxylase alpha chain